MAFEYLTNLPLEQARRDYIELLIEKGMGPAAETIPAAEAAGRITAEAVYANISAPHYAARGQRRSVWSPSRRNFPLYLPP